MMGRPVRSLQPAPTCTTRHHHDVGCGCGGPAQFGTHPPKRTVPLTMYIIIILQCVSLYATQGLAEQQVGQAAAGACAALPHLPSPALLRNVCAAEAAAAPGAVP